MKGKSGKNKNNRNNSNNATTTTTTTTTSSASALIRPESNTTATPKLRLSQQQPAARWSTTGGGTTASTTTVGTGLVSTSSSSTSTAAAAAAATTILSQQDVHPYARGSVIEVWHISKANQNTNDEDDWWTDDDDDDDDDDDEPETDPQQLQQKREKTILLCDIIDRVPTTTTTTTNSNNHRNHKSKATTSTTTNHKETQTTTAAPQQSWRYYVHYRDYNRRMDEWIPSSRIVSPPSVGNAKVRAIKKQEMIQLRHKRKQQQQQQFATGITAGIGHSVSTLDFKMATNSSTTATTTAGSTTTMTTTTTTTTTSAIILDRRTRRRKSTKPDPEENDGMMMLLDTDADAMDTANTKTPSPLKQPPPPPPTDISSNNKQQQQQQQPLLTTTTIQVGEHVVATVQAVELDEHEGMDEASLREHEEVTKIKNVGFLELGRHQMETWYYSPLPKEIINGNTGGNLSNHHHHHNNNNHQGFLDVLYVCEFTLRLFARKSELQRFQARVPIPERHPPGNEIYRHDNLAMFEVDGSEEKIYCQNLCYIAKLFLDHKTLYYDVDPFLFYVLCELDERGYHPVGYFSKEKYSDVGYNLACILSFPAHQRKGYGRFLIAFSYELTKKEEKVGSPEKPMSDLGQQAYKPYWASTIIDFLLNQSDETSLSIMDISKRTSIMSDDIVFTLNQLGILKIINGVYFIAAEQGMLMELAIKYPIKEPRIDPSKLHWTPYLTDIRRDKFSIHSKKQSLDAETTVV